MSSKQKLKCRKRKSILRYHIPNQQKDPEKYAHHLLLMFLPFRSEAELSSSSDGTFLSKLGEPGVLPIISQNKLKFEPFGDIVDETLYNFTSREINSEDQENIPEEMAENCDHEERIEADTPSDGANLSTAPILSDDEISTMINSLNDKQMEIFQVLNKWAREHLKNLSSVQHMAVPPLHLFVSGSGGCSKSYLIKTLYHSVRKLLCYNGQDLDKERVLLLAPTGIAAINIGGTTIHSAFQIPIKFHSRNIPKLSDNKRSVLRNKYSEVSVIIIDEISMVSNILLLHIHQRLTEIFSCNNRDLMFAGKTVIAVGDLCQLPPVNSKHVFAPYKDNLLNFAHPWQLFKIAELVKTVRQEELSLISLLHNVRVAQMQEANEELLKSRFIDKSDPNYPQDALHVFAENSLADQHNTEMLDALDNALFIIKAFDTVPNDAPSGEVQKCLRRKQSLTAGLAAKLCIKVGARVMLTSNVSISDRLINGQIGTVASVKRNSDAVVEVIYVKFDDVNAGVLQMNNDVFARHNHVVPLTRIEGQILIGPSTTKGVITRIQFPLMLAWACTVHKVQGLTLDNAVISFQLEKQKIFNYGQMYVALSRVKTIDGLYCIGNYNSAAIRCDPKSLLEYEILRESSRMRPIDEEMKTDDNGLTISVLNCRSLRKHANDIKRVNSLISSDALFLTETQIKQGSPVHDISAILSEFTIIYDNNDNQYSSVASCIKPFVEICDHEHFTAGFSKITILKNLFSNINILLVYRKPNDSLSSFLEVLHYLMQARNIDIILGDFNINGLIPNPASSLLEDDYELILKEPTHLSGSMLDHVYISKQLLIEINVDAFVCTLFFSDHDAIKIHLSSKRCV